jgi:hypothetical protein
MKTIAYLIVMIAMTTSFEITFGMGNKESVAAPVNSLAKAVINQ